MRRPVATSSRVMLANASVQKVPTSVARVDGIVPLSCLRERVGVRAWGRCKALKKGPHPTLRATFSREEREKGSAAGSPT